MRLVLGPPPPATRVYAALGDQERYFETDGELLRPAYGAEPPAPFPQSAPWPRFAVMGGSSVHGGTPGAGLDREFPGRAARMLGVEGLNLGSPGLDSHDLARMVAELDGVELDALVLYTGHNDFGNTHFEGRYGTVSSALVARGRSLLGRLQLYAQLTRLVLGPSGELRRSRGGMAPQAGSMLPLNPARVELALAGLVANLERILWLAEAQGWPVVLMVPVSQLTLPPDRQGCDRPGCPADLLREADQVADTDPERAQHLLQLARDADPMGIRAPTAAESAIRALGDRPGVTLVDCFVALPRDRRFPVPARELFIDPVHLSLRGHSQVGALLALALEPILSRTATLPADAEALRGGG